MNELQIQASNPNHSVWVSASAGTGKTKILTDRVLRLLVGGVEFKKILCLTFTNAASNEMQSRINSTLAYFASIDESILRNQLFKLLGTYPTIDEIRNAKVAYNELLNSDDKINIYTIHSYCQKILKSFPLEAGINPAFQILDEFEEKTVIRNVKMEILSDHDNSGVIEFFVKNCHDVVLDEILDQILSQKLKFKSVETRCPQLQCAQNNIRYDEAVKSFFLTKDGSKRKNLGKNCTSETLQQQDSVYEFDQNEKMQAAIQYSTNLVKLAKIFLKRYEEYKLDHSLLDYDDLIYYTHQLLTNKAATDWVLYKLDGGIDHLLVDEAQDTSKEQWQIIESIISEFYSGDGVWAQKRTIFVVGDDKQSIFSFQGADLASFSAMNNLLKEKLLNAKKDFHIINLQSSYRSTEEILEAVYGIFNHIKSLYPELFPIPNIKIYPHRKHSGKVDLWPLIKAEKEQEKPWPLPEDHKNYLNPKTRLAIKIAEHIKNQIDQKIILPSTNKPARPQDFMILVRKRDDFTIEIINQLKNLNLGILGLDRISLNENLLVLDLIVAAKFVLNPYNDLNLACLLRTPLIGLPESDLEYLRASCNSSLWCSILLKRNEDSIKYAYTTLTLLIDIYRHVSGSNFFNALVDCLDLRSNLIASNGLDSVDVINEFLYLVNKYTTTAQNSLQGFLYWFDTNQMEIKRNIENSSKIKVMTIHAAKGLQAPIVILADTTSIPVSQSKFFWCNDTEIIASMNAEVDPQLLKDLKGKEKQKELQEYVRLLYVALTRAQDHLIICGYSNTAGLSPYCWYSLVSGSLLHTESTINNDSCVALARPQLEILEYRNTLNTAFIQNAKTILHHDVISAPSPVVMQSSLEYGRVFHKILEDAAKARNIKLLNLHPLIGTLSINLQDKLHKNAQALLLNQDFLDLFSHEIKTEVNIGTLENNNAKINRVDLIAINYKQVTIIDYKSDKPCPIEDSQVPIHYIEQLNSYRAVMSKIYPNHEIICKILWLENGRFSIVPLGHPEFISGSQAV